MDGSVGRYTVHQSRGHGDRRRAGSAQVGWPAILHWFLIGLKHWGPGPCAWGPPRLNTIAWLYRSDFAVDFWIQTTSSFAHRPDYHTQKQKKKTDILFLIDAKSNSSFIPICNCTHSCYTVIFLISFFAGLLPSSVLCCAGYLSRHVDYPSTQHLPKLRREFPCPPEDGLL